MTLTETPFLINGKFDIAAIMRDAHRRAKKMRAAHIEAAKDPRKAITIRPYASYVALYLGQVWALAQHQMRAYRAIFAQPTIVREGTLAYAHFARD